MSNFELCCVAIVKLEMMGLASFCIFVLISETIKRFRKYRMRKKEKRSAILRRKQRRLETLREEGEKECLENFLLKLRIEK